MGNVAGYRAALRRGGGLHASEEWNDYLRESGDEIPERDLKLETLAGVLRGQDPGAEPLLPRRRDGPDARPRPGVRLQDPLVPPRGRGLQDRRPARPGQRRGELDLVRLVGLQDGVARRHPGERRAAAAGRRPRDHPLRQPRTASSASTRRPRGRCTPGATPASRSPASRRSAGSPRTRPGRSASTAPPARSSRARRPTWCVWSGDPFSVYSKAERVYNDGWLVFDRDDPKRQYRTDFNLGTSRAGGGPVTRATSAARLAAARCSPGAPAGRADHRHHRRHRLSGIRAEDRARHGRSSATGRIVAVGADVAVPSGADAGGRHRPVGHPGPDPLRHHARRPPA